MKLSRLPLLLAILAALALLVAGPGVRLELWHFGTGFTLMRYAAFAGIGAAALALLGLAWPKLRREGARGLAIALVLGGLVVALPWLQLRQARSVPPIHDISTDLTEPPVFSAIVALRGDSSNPLDRADPALPDQQRGAYPNVLPAIVPQPPAEAFPIALSAVQTLGWEIVSADPDAYIIEATDTTLWFGFKDDVVVRIRAEGEGSRIDVRSVSRVGRSDLGANARRILAYTELLGHSQD